jgi:membrane protein YqaA with SNARE-associated domain
MSRLRGWAGGWRNVAILRFAKHLRTKAQNLATQRASERWLALVALANGSVVPFPAELLLVPMCCRHPPHWLRYCVIATLFSVFGAALGYVLGAFAFDWLLQSSFSSHVVGAEFQLVRNHIADHGIIYVLTGSLTPLPSKFVALAAGAASMNIWMFLAVVTLSRLVGYGLVASAAAGARVTWQAVLRKLR